MKAEADLRRLQDRVDIIEMIHAYCRYADNLDAERMSSLFTDDCVVSYVPLTVAQPVRGRSSLNGFFQRYFPESVSSSHYVSNIELLFDSADTVIAHTYMYSWERRKGYPVHADCHRYGRYEMRIVRATGQWKFSHMRLLSMGEYGGTRIGEQFGRPWPPQFGD